MLVQEYEYARFDALAVLGRLMKKIDVFATFQGGDQTLSRVEGWIRYHGRCASPAAWRSHRAASAIVFTAPIVDFRRSPRPQPL